MIAYETSITVSAPWLEGDLSEVIRSRAGFREGIECMLDELDGGKVSVDWISRDQLRVVFMAVAAMEEDVLGSLSGAIADAVSMGASGDESADVGIFLSVPPGTTIH